MGCALGLCRVTAPIHRHPHTTTVLTLDDGDLALVARADVGVAEDDVVELLGDPRQLCPASAQRRFELRPNDRVMLEGHAGHGLPDHVVGEGRRDLADRGRPRRPVDADQEAPVDVPGVASNGLCIGVLVAKGYETVLVPARERLEEAVELNERLIPIPRDGSPQIAAAVLESRRLWAMLASGMERWSPKLSPWPSPRVHGSG